ncbi:uncharacterized protein LOC119352105 [Triticum dicoccoides]|uniref:uncharacterized protein LOC119352105 n=1 Tax=Triticum dicoccoides TaxID=85692 RepID=UPI00188E1078|nr:uncharacterized protein LOC119352105 [Triticum dicoccoides]
MAAKVTSSSCFAFLKEALILPTLNPKLFAPVLLLFAVTAFLDSLDDVVFVQPLVDDMGSRLIAVNSTDPLGAEYTKLTEETEPGGSGTKLLLITIAQLVVGGLALGLVKQILTLFAASTTYSGDRYSLAELLRELVKGRISVKGPSVTIAVVDALDFASAVLAALIPTPALMGGLSGVLSVQGLVSHLANHVSLCFTVVALVGVTASAVDRRCSGVRALRQAWRLVTRVRRKEGLVLVLMAYLGPTAVAPLHGFALGYAKRSTAACLCLLAVYGLLSGAQEHFSLAAATVYYYQAMESKEVIDALCLLVSVHV